MSFKENGKVSLSGWSMKWKYVYEGTKEEGLRRKNEAMFLLLTCPQILQGM